MESQVDFFKSKIITARIKEMRARDPKLSFTQAWDRLRKAEPELFAEQPGWDPETGTQFGQLRQEKLAGYGDPFSRDKKRRNQLLRQATAIAGKGEGQCRG